MRCAFPMPEVLCIGLGGSTKVLETADHSVVVGPESVGHRLLTEALVFGGQTLTVTGRSSFLARGLFADAVVDIAVAANAAEVGDASKVSTVSPETVKNARLRVKKMLEDGVDRMKLTADDAVLVLVGGGSIAQMDNLEGVSQIIRPP